MPAPQAKPSLAGSLRIFQFAGISVYVHWSWLLVGYYEVQFRSEYYGDKAWAAAEYLTLFLIVLLHEFGHALACRQVGGKANEIVLWPLGGIAFVQPPVRPGALLWSIAAGPLVNLALAPLTITAYFVAANFGLHETYPDAAHFLAALAVLNLVLLVFNLLPIYPLDGGQILQALLWFFIGRANSLFVVSIIGMAAAAAAIALAIGLGDIWIGVLAGFAALRSWAGFQQARLLAKMAAASRHGSARCPSCGAHPIVGEWWTCPCGARFDVFATGLVCPRCERESSAIACPDCLEVGYGRAWFAEDHFTHDGSAGD